MPMTCQYFLTLRIGRQLNRRSGGGKQRFCPALRQKTAGALPPGRLFARQAIYQHRIMRITDILRAEHTVFHHLFDHIENSAPRLKTLLEVKSLATLAEHVMAPHSRTEDELFIEPLEHCFEQIGQGETFHHEHELIEDIFAKVRTARDLKTAKKFLLGAIAASRKHFDKEERIVFPLAERVLKAKTLTELGTEWMKRREAILK
jgi:hemerythrin-like domain-containing protein